MIEQGEARESIFRQGSDIRFEESGNEADARRIVEIFMRKTNKATASSEGLQAIRELLTVKIPRKARSNARIKLENKLQYGIGVAREVLARLDRLTPFLREELTGETQNVRQDIIEMIDEAETPVQEQDQRAAA